MTETLRASDLRSDFRDAMSCVAGSVSVVTTSAGGRPYGTTVTAFVSLSMDPPIILVSLARTSSLLAQVEDRARLGVNVLAADKAGVAAQFSRRGVDRFAGVTWREVHGAPILSGVHAWAAVEVSRTIEAGDHVLLLGEVLAAHGGEGSPLTYWRRGYGTHRPV